MALENEELIRLQDVPGLLPKVNGKSVHWITCFRWATRGVRGIRLQATFTGGRRATSRQAVERFLAALAARDNQPEPADTMRKRSRELKSKNDALAAAGF